MAAANAITVFYWPSGSGHIAVQLSNGYISHVPDGRGREVGRRTDVPGYTGTLMIIKECASARHRTLADDMATYGAAPQTLRLSEQFIEFNIEQAARGWLLVTPPNEPPRAGEVLHGPLPYYQLADSVKGAGDRQQCATTTARVLAAGLTLEHQDIIKTIRGHFAPGPLFAYLKTLG